MLKPYPISLYTHGCPDYCHLIGHPMSTAGRFLLVWIETVLPKALGMTFLIDTASICKLKCPAHPTIEAATQKSTSHLMIGGQMSR